MTFEAASFLPRAARRRWIHPDFRAERVSSMELLNSVRALWYHLKFPPGRSGYIARTHALRSARLPLFPPRRPLNCRLSNLCKFLHKPRGTNVGKKHGCFGRSGASNGHATILRAFLICSLNSNACNENKACKLLARASNMPRFKKRGNWRCGEPPETFTIDSGSNFFRDPFANPAEDERRRSGVGKPQRTHDVG